MIHSSARISNVDLVRGLVLVLMVLDHTRDWFGDHTISALDVSQASTQLFFSRWITHLCAPTFVFLAGVSAFIQYEKKGARATAYYLVSRGIILVVLEQTFLRCFGWYFNFDYRYMNANVLWGMGGSMVLLGFFIFLPRFAVMVMGLIIIVFHDLLLQTVSIPADSNWYFLWVMFFKSGNIEFIQSHNFYVSYPIIPWFGIMAFGYGMGKIIMNGVSEKRRLLVWALSFLVVFMLFRFFLLYGNPSGWRLQETPWRSFLSFINLEKYPPSFLFTLLTLSVTMFFLAVIDCVPSLVRNILQRLGQTSLFFYVLHIIVIHAMAVMIAFLRYGKADWLYTGPGIFWDENLPGHPADYGLSLVWVYAISFLVIVLLYPCCGWYLEFKRRGGAKWLKYF